MEKAEEFQNLQAQLQNLLIQKEALKLQKFELEKALNELQNSKEEKAYRVIGNVMVVKSKNDLINEIKGELEDLNLKIQNLEKIESRMVEKLKSLEKEMKG